MPARPEPPIFALLVLFSLFARAQAPHLSVPSGVAAPGTSLSIPIAFSAASGHVSAIQFDLQYDSSVMSVAATPGDAPRLGMKQLYLSGAEPGRERFVIVGGGRDQIPDGMVMVLFLNTRPDAASNTYTLALSNVAGSDPDGAPVSVETQAGSLVIQGAAAEAVPLAPEGILNAASLLPGSIAPGEAVALIGSGIGAAGEGTAVLFNGIAAQLLYVSPDQINAVVPDRLSSDGTVTVRIGGQTAAEVPAGAASPGIYTLDGTGIGEAAAVNADLTVNSPLNPAQRGSLITLFADAGGAITAPAVRIADIDAEVLSVERQAGALRVTCRIPETTPSSAYVPVVLRIGPSDSQSGTTLAVK